MLRAARVRDHDVAGGRDVHALGRVQRERGARDAAGRASSRPAARERGDRAVLVDPADAVVGGVGHQHVAVGQPRQVARLVQLGQRGGAVVAAEARAAGAGDGAGRGRAARATPPTAANAAAAVSAVRLLSRSIMVRTTYARRADICVTPFTQRRCALGWRRVLATPRLAAVADGGGRPAVRGARSGAPGALGAGFGRAGHRGPALPVARRPGQAEGHRAGGDRLPEPAGAAPAAAAAAPPARPGDRPAAPRGRAGRWSTTCSSPSPPTPSTTTRCSTPSGAPETWCWPRPRCARTAAPTSWAARPTSARPARGWATRRCRRPTRTA